MTTSTIVLIVVIAVAAILAIAAIAWVARKKRTEHRRVEAGDIRDKATDESHKVGQREAFADETAAKARVAQAEADAKTAHAAGLQHQAQVPEDVPSSVELRWRSGEHQAALTSSLCTTGPTGSAISRSSAARSVGRCR